MAPCACRVGSLLTRQPLTVQAPWLRCRAVLPALREVDLYGFQGLVKEEGKERFGEAYKRWQRDPANFELDGHVGSGSCPASASHVHRLFLSK